MTVKFTKKSKISTFNSCDNREETISAGEEYPYRTTSRGQEEMKYYDSYGQSLWTNLEPYVGNFIVYEK